MREISELALAEAKELGLDLDVHMETVPVHVFKFTCLAPKPEVLRAFLEAKALGLPWVEGMPMPVVTWHPKKSAFRIMDGMMRISAAQEAGIREIPVFVASGDTYEELEEILEQGYYGEDFVEMLAMVNPEIRRNTESRDENRMAGR